MMGDKIKSKTGIIFQCPPVSSGVVRIRIESDVDIDVYYADKENIENLKSTGNFKDKSGVLYTRKGRKFEEDIRTISGESYFVVVNDTAEDGELTIEIKSVNLSPSVLTYTASTSGYGTS